MWQVHRKLALTFCASLGPSVFKCPLCRLASCGILWVRLSQWLSFFLSYEHAGDHFESSLGTCCHSCLVMTTPCILPDQDQDHLPSSILPASCRPASPSPRHLCPCAQCHCYRVHTAMSFVREISSWPNFDLAKGGDYNLWAEFLPAPHTVFNIFIAFW